MTDPTFPLPAAQTALSPYIHPPKEALHIRQLATVHLSNLSSEKRTTNASGSTDEYYRFLDFELGRKASSNEGVRRQYLLALRANHEARREYEAALHVDDEDKEEGQEEAGQEEEGGGWRELYLNTLKLRRQRERLELLRVYLNTVSNPHPAEVEVFNEAPPAPPVELAAMQGAAAPEEAIKSGVEAIILRLEKEVVTAYEDLETENARIRALQRGLGGDPQGTKKEALVKARDTLIAWIEGQLARTTATAEDEDMADAPDAPATEDAVSAEVIVERIQDAYTAYLTSRSELVQVLTAASVDSEPGPLTLDTVEPTELPATMKKPLPAPPILSALTAIEHLLPLTKYSKALLHHRTQLSSSLSSQQLHLLRTLESALATYNIQPPQIDTNTVKPAAEMATALANAAKKAVAAGAVEVGRNVDGATKTLERVEGVLGEVESMVVRERGSRIPVAPKGRRGREEVVEEKRGWGGIGGGVGVIGDGI